MGPDDLAFHAGLWLRTPGPDADVVLSTRIRLARNVDGYAFPSRIGPDERSALEGRLKGWIAEARLDDEMRYCRLEGIDEVSGQMLVERHLISRELLRGQGARGVSFGTSEQTSVMTNEEDHLRIQVLRAGCALSEALDAAVAVDRRMEVLVPYAFSETHGYLTSCPTNAGTGLRISVMMHIPGLIMADQMDKVFQASSRVGLTVRGFYGEGSKAVGDVIQISNQQTLGRSEEDLLESLGHMVPKIVEYERGIREHLRTERRATLDDRIWRAVGLLRYARRMSSEEGLNHLSAVRLGVALQMLPWTSLSEITELFVLTQPGHLQALEGRVLTPEDRDLARANLLRERLKPESA